MRPLKGWSAVALALGLALLTAPRRARATEGGAAVVAPLSALGIEPAELKRVQRWVVAASSSIGGFRWLGTSRMARALSQPGLRGCAEAGCLARAGRKAGASWVVTGDVGSLSGTYVVYLRLLRARDGKVIRSASGELDPRAQGLRRAARVLAVRLLAPKSYTGALRVEVDVPQAWVYLDGERVGRGPVAKLESVTVGPHALRVTHESHRDYVRFVEVGYEQRQTLKVELSALPVGTGKMRLLGEEQGRPLTSAELPWYRRWWAVAGFGAVLLAATTTTVALLASRAVDRDSEAWVHR